MYMSPTKCKRIGVLVCSTWAVIPLACAGPGPRPIPPVEPLTRERALEYAQHSEEEDRAHAEALQRNPAMMQFLDECDALIETGARLSTAKDAEWLAAKLYEDKGHAGLNGRWQSIVIREMIDFGLRTGVAPSPSHVLRNALIDYASRCPTTGNPACEADLALALTIFGGPDYPSCDSLAAERLARARQWASALYGTRYASFVANRERKILRAIRWRSNPLPIKRIPLQSVDDTCRPFDDEQTNEH